MSVDELSVMDGAKCILQLLGVRPFLSDKYDITRHKNYRLLSDSNPRYVFDIGKFVSTKLKVNPNEGYEMYEYTPADEDMPDGIAGEFQSSGDETDDDIEFEIDLEPI